MISESAEFQDAADLIQQLNGILAKPVGFPQIPIPRKDCHTFYAKLDERRKYVMNPEQDCEWLVSDQNTSMVEAIGAHDHHLSSQRVHGYYEWQKKSDKGVKTSKDAWVWEEGSSSR